MSTEQIFYKDAVFAAVQIGAYDLYDYVDFDALLHNTLQHEVAAVHPWSKVLRRRVALLIAKWIPVKVHIFLVIFWLFLFLYIVSCCSLK
mgnify:CR=1 FL=1